MTFDEIVAFIQANKDSEEMAKVAAILPSAKLDADTVRAFIESPDGEKLIKSGTVKSVEAHVRAILDRQAEKRAGEIDSEKKARMTVEEKLAELEKRLSEKDQAAARAEWKSKAYQLASSKGVPVEFVDTYGGDPDAIESFLDMIVDRDSKIRTEIEKKAFADSYKPGGSQKTAAYAVDYKNLSPAERLAKATAEAEKRMSGNAGA